jgi:hypothetical protein
MDKTPEMNMKKQKITTSFQRGQEIKDEKVQGVQSVQTLIRKEATSAHERPCVRIGIDGCSISEQFLT